MSSPAVNAFSETYLSTSSSTSSFKYSDEWTAVLSRSCLNMSVMEPCVNRAAAHLEDLKGLVKEHQKKSSELRRPSMKSPPQKKLVRVKSGEAMDTMVEVESSPELMVEGFSTGIPTLKSDSSSSLVVKVQVSVCCY